MSKNTITSHPTAPTALQRPVRIGPPGRAAAASAQAAQAPLGRTAWLGGQLNTLHFKTFVTLWVGGIGMTLFAVIILLAALLPRLLYLGEAMGGYQPGTYTIQGPFSWPGEDANHPSEVILTYSDRLTILTIPAGDLARLGALQSDTQRGLAPRIESVTAVSFRGKPALEVSVNLNYLSLFADSVTYTLVNNAANMSTDPGNPNYHAPGFAIQKGVLT